jgi:hypothetical protein
MFDIYFSKNIALKYKCKMPQRNGYRSARGRSAVARISMRTAGSNNGFLPQVTVVDQNNRSIRNAMFFGGSSKGGLAPHATGFYVAPSSAVAVKPSGKPRPNFLFVMKTQVGSGPRGFPSVGRV